MATTPPPTAASLAVTGAAVAAAAGAAVAAAAGAAAGAAASAATGGPATRVGLEPSFGRVRTMFCSIRSWIYLLDCRGFTGSGGSAKLQVTSVGSNWTSCTG